MNFEFSEEQRAFRESVRRYLTDNYSFEKRRDIVRNDAFFSHEHWQDTAQLGWLYLMFAEEHGGLGGDALDSVLLFQELGRSLVVEPFLETLVLAGGILRRVSTTVAEAQLTKLMNGQLQGALAHSEIGCRGLRQSPNTRARRLENHYLINGAKAVVHNAANADLTFVTAQMENGTVAIFEVHRDDPGVGIHAYATIDGRGAADLTLTDTQLPLDRRVASGEKATVILQEIQSDAIIASGADMLGSMNTLLESTVEYTAQRKQFGSRLVDFQVLRHKMVDMFIAIELATSLLYAAAIKVRDGSPDAAAMAAAAKAKVDKSAKFVAHTAIQLHGGIATTNELAIGHHLKRIAVYEQRFGSSTSQLRQYHQLTAGAPSDEGLMEKVAAQVA
ncbi:MAG: acyl-CoA dehydrogenase [Pseudomonadota bacterium]